MSRKVIYAKLHAGVFIPGVGNLADTLPPASKTLTDLTMSKQEDGNLLISWTSLNTAQRLSAEVGASNIIVLAYEPESLKKL